MEEFVINMESDSFTIVQIMICLKPIGLRKHATQQKQTFIFCGVDDHHHNEKHDNRIKDVTIGASTALLHAAHNWTNAIHA